MFLLRRWFLVLWADESLGALPTSSRCVTLRPPSEIACSGRFASLSRRLPRRPIAEWPSSAERTASPSRGDNQWLLSRLYSDSPLIRSNITAADTPLVVAPV
jgi:hypothetical protein